MIAALGGCTGPLCLSRCLGPIRHRHVHFNVHLAIISRVTTSPSPSKALGPRVTSSHASYTRHSATAQQTRQKTPQRDCIGISKPAASSGRFPSHPCIRPSLRPRVPRRRICGSVAAFKDGTRRTTRGLSLFHGSTETHGFCFIVRHFFTCVRMSCLGLLFVMPTMPGQVRLGLGQAGNYLQPTGIYEFN